LTSQVNVRVDLKIGQLMPKRRAFYQKESTLIRQAKERIKELEQVFVIAYRRWEKLESINQTGKK